MKQDTSSQRPHERRPSADNLLSLRAGPGAVCAWPRPESGGHLWRGPIAAIGPPQEPMQAQVRMRVFVCVVDGQGVAWSVRHTNDGDTK
jgi:hypothetical protein